MFSVLVLYLITCRGLSLKVHISHRTNLLQEEEIRTVGPQAFVLIFSLTLSLEKQFGCLQFPCYHLFLSLCSTLSSVLSLVFSLSGSEYTSSPALVAVMQSFGRPTDTSRPKSASGRAAHYYNIIITIIVWRHRLCVVVDFFLGVFCFPFIRPVVGCYVRLIQCVLFCLLWSIFLSCLLDESFVVSLKVLTLQRSPCLHKTIHLE